MQYKIWTIEEEKKLAEMNKKGYSIERMSKELDRSKDSVRMRMKRLAILPGYKNRRWTKEQDANFSADWKDGEISNAQLCKRYNRSLHSLKQRAVLLKLGVRPFDGSLVTLQEVSKEMGVSDDKLYWWVNHLGLPTHKSCNNRTKHLIDERELILFLGQHQNLFNASFVSEYLFSDEPEWLTLKRKKDGKEQDSKSQCEWTNEEDAELQNKIKAAERFGKDMDELLAELARRFHRTKNAVKYHAYVIGCPFPRKGAYLERELSYLKKWSGKKTVSEMAKYLGRTEKAIQNKCAELGLPYHISEKRCKKENEGKEIEG